MEEYQETKVTETRIMTIRRALEESYRKNDKLSIPFREEDPAISSPFLIKDSYRNLALLRSSTDQDVTNADRFESSLSHEQGNVYGKVCPLILDQLFAPIGNSREIKRILVSGPAGIGKSTLCHHLAYQWGEGQMFNDANGSLFDAVFWLTLKEIPLLMKGGKKLTLAGWILHSCFDEDILTNHPISENEIQKLLFVTHKTRCLLILDGFDEVSGLFAEKEGRCQKLLQIALEYPQAVVTTRPYGRATLQRLGFDREVEDVGFSDESIQKFIGHYFDNEKLPEQANLLWQTIQQQPTLKRIAAIPLQTYFLCSTWMGSLRKFDQNSKMRITDLYQLFIREIWVRRLSQVAQQSLLNFNSIEKNHHDLLFLFSKIAYHYFTHDKEQLLISSNQLTELVAQAPMNIDIKQLTSFGFIRTDAEGNYLFVHLSLQEFFAANHLYQKLISNNEREQAEVLRFVLRNKYHSRYEIVMTFLIGLAHRNSVATGVKKLLWDALFVFDVDWIGVRHVQLIIRALEESGRLGNPEDINPRDRLLLDQVVDWVLASLNSPYLEFSSMLRSQLLPQLAVCPIVTQRTFDQLVLRYSSGQLNDFWAALSTDQQKRLLSDYWLPLLHHLSAAYPEFLITLLTESHQDEALIFLQSIDWSTLKNTPLREKLLRKISHSMEQSWSRPSEAIRRLLPAWLSLLQAGDDQTHLLTIMDEHDEPWLRWAAWLSQAILNPRDKADFLKELLFRLEQQHSQHEILLLIVSVISDWTQPRNEVINVWWILLKEEDVTIHQRAAQRLDALLDKTTKNDDRYQQLQQVLWQRRHWPLATPGHHVLFRQERFTILLKALRHDDKAIFYNALKTLEHCDANQWNSLESNQIVEMLLNALNDNIVEHYIRIAVVKALSGLAQHHVSKVSAALLRATQDVKSIVRNTAISKLSLLSEEHTRQVLPVFLRAYGVNYNVEAGSNGLVDLAQHCANTVFPVLLQAIKNGPDILRIAATRALEQVGKLHTSEVLPKLLQATQDKKYHVRAAAMRALGQLGEHYASQIFSALLAIYNNITSNRSAAIEALAGFGGHHISKVLPILLQAALDQDKEIDVRTAAIGALRQFGEQHVNDVLPMLLQASQDKEIDVRTAAIGALRQFGEQHVNDVLPMLLQASQDKEIDVRTAAIGALRQFGEQHVNDVLPMLLQASQDRNIDVRTAAIKALGQFAEHHISEVLPLLQWAIQDKEMKIRWAAIEALKQVCQHHACDVLPLFVKASLDDDKHIRFDVIKALVQLGHNQVSEILPIILLGIQDKELKVQNVAIRALALLAQNHSNEVLPIFLSVIKEHAINLSDTELSFTLWGITTCSLSFFSGLIEKFQHPENINAATILLPLICNFRLQLTKTTLFIDPAPLSLAELVNAMTLLADLQQRATLSSELQRYYNRHKGFFTEQLAECLQQQMISPSEIALLCQMLTISSTSWLSELDSWFKRKNSSEDWRFPLACLAQLLCNEGASFCFTQNQWVLCQRTEMILLDLTLDSRFMTLLLEQIKEYQQALQIPHQQAQTLLQRDLPLLLPRSKARFFSGLPLEASHYQPVYTYQKTRASQASVDCQELCTIVFQQVRLLPVNQQETYELWQDLERQAYKITLPKDRLFDKARFSKTLKVLFQHKCIKALDLSGNKLSDRELILVCQYLKHYDGVRILKLSHNQITVDGLSTLVMTLRQKASVKYLLLDHNWIAADPSYCAALIEREKELQLVNLDLSFNYIPRGALIEGKILADEATLRNEFNNAVDYCQRSIMRSLVQSHAKSAGQSQLS
jgi:HEAT repeat protein/DNA polymerase III delta prime subunit